MRKSKRYIMQKGIVYDTSDMQLIWHQIATHNKWIDRLHISMDGGQTFLSVREHGLSIDVGKWYWSGWFFKWI